MVDVDKGTMRKTMFAVLKAADEVLEDLGMSEVGTRPSWGRWATYLRASRGSMRGAYISIGSNCIELHLTGVGADRVQTEMRQFGWDHKYGESPAVELACVVLHEVGHAVVHRQGRRQYGVAHGAAFYEEYRKLVEERVETVAVRIAELAGIPKLLDDPASQLVVAANAAQFSKAVRTLLFSGEFHVGDQVEFTSRKFGEVRGKIVRRGQKRWTIRPESGTGYSKFFVPERMLRKIESEPKTVGTQSPWKAEKPAVPPWQFKVGDAVEVFTYGRWFVGRIVQVKRRFKVVTTCGRTVYAKLSQLGKPK